MNKLRGFLMATVWTAALAPQAMYADHHEAVNPSNDAAMMEAFQASMTPGEPHQKLAGQVGNFTAVVKSFENPDGPPVESTSSVVRKMTLNGRVLEEQWSGTVMGMPFYGVGRTGYDNVTQRFWSTWTDNLSTGLFVAYGNVDEASGALVLKGVMPDPMSGAMIKTRSVAHFGVDGGETMTMYRERDGQEVKMMEFVISPE